MDRSALTLSRQKSAHRQRPPALPGASPRMHDRKNVGSLGHEAIRAHLRPIVSRSCGHAPFCGGAQSSACHHVENSKCHF